MMFLLTCPLTISTHISLVSSLWYLCFSTAVSQSCYYPDGSLSQEQDVQCSSASVSACCPLNWQCLSNGLCYLENEGYLGRYTCTDQSWGPDCPQICTHNNTASGNEAVLECSQGNYCCDTNRPTPGCCDTGGGLFSLSAGQAAPSIDTASSAAVASASATSQVAAPSTSQIPTSSTLQSSLSPSSGTAAASSLAAASSSPTSAPGTSLVTVTKVTTTSAGAGIATVTAISTVSPSSSSLPSSTQPVKSSNKADIIAPAVAVPVVLIIIAIIAFLLWRNRRNKKRNTAEDHGQLAYDNKSSPSTQGPGADIYGYNAVAVGEAGEVSGYRGVSRTAPGNPQHYSHLSSELDGGPISPSHSELPGNSPVSQQHWETGSNERNPGRYRPVSYELPGDPSGR